MEQIKHENSIKYISQSLLLEEKTNPIILQFLIMFFVLVIASFIVWASYMDVDEVTVAPGKIIPVDEIYKVQHLEGGIIKRVYVKDGDYIKFGEPILELDGKSIKSELRLNQAKLNSYKRKLIYVKEQVKIRSKLFKKGLNSRMSFLSLLSEKSDVEGQILETNEVISELRSKVKRLGINAPASGIVHGFGSKTKDSIIGASELIMEIIPKDRRLIAEVQISANDIGHIKIGQKVTLKFNTYDFGKYGGKFEKLTSISPMTFLEPQSGKAYYNGTIALSSSFLGKIKRYPIIPGMTLVAEIKTGQKTIMEYLLKPVFISAKSALREK